MIKYAAFLVESLVLATPYWISLKLASRAIGANIGAVWFAGAVLATLAANILIVEVSGPENILLYRLAVIALCASVLFWFLSRLFRKFT